jgi:methylthioribose-1-phosphate isomerase
MTNFASRALKIEEQKLSLLDQTLLPHEERWLLMDSEEDLIEAIQSLRVRGAPLIGVAAAVFLQLQKDAGLKPEKLNSMALKIREARPTAVNLMICVDQFLSGVSGEQILFEDVDLCNKIGIHGAKVIEPGDNVLTHCNTGGLATVGIGTALGVIETAHKQNKKIHVFVDETRPLLQGGRLTAWELGKSNIPYTLTCDNMAGTLMRSGRVQKILVGADRIAQNGDFANKVGTYSVAVLARHHNVPFYVCAPYTTIDLKISQGEEIEIEMRKKEEVHGITGALGSYLWAPKDSPVFNPAFDVTPSELVTGYILDNGLFTREEFLKAFKK